MRALRIVGWVVGGLLVLVVVVAGCLLLFGGELLRGPAERMASSALHRQVTIGSLDLGLDGFTLVVDAGEVTVANPDWADAPEMLKTRLISVGVPLGDLIGGEFVLSHLRIVKPEANLRRRQDGKASWDFGTETDGQGGRSIPAIRRLDVEDGHLTLVDAKLPLELEGDFHSEPGDAGDAGGAIVFDGQGRYAEGPAKLSVRGGSILSLRDRTRPFPIKASLDAGATHADIDGTLQDPFSLAGLSLQLHLKGPDLGELYPLIGVAMPNTPPYDVNGRLVLEQGVWHYEDFAGTVGDSDLAGDFSYDPTKDRPFIQADLKSDSLDPDDLGSFVGAPVGTAEGETASEEQRQYSEAYQKRDRLLPTATLDVSRLQAVDAKVHYEAGKLALPGVPLTNLSLDMDLERTLMTLEPIRAGALGGQVLAKIILNGRDKPVQTDYDMVLRDLELAQIVKNVAGRLDGRVRLTGFGDSVAKSLANSNGDITAFMRDGSIDELIVELMGLDLADALGVVVSGGETAKIRCALADFQVKDGMMRTRRFFIDTTDNVIVGQARVNLKDETFEADLDPNEKGISLFSGQSSVHLEGRFKDPSISLNLGETAVRAGAAVALGVAATPLASVLAFLDIGGASDVNCNAFKDASEGKG